MKTILLGLIFLGFTNLMHSQNELAYVKVNIEAPVKIFDNAMINSNYFNSFDKKISSKRVRKFQKVVAKYDIKSSDVYTSDEEYSYTVVFEEGENQIEAEYNQAGEIVKCSEFFKNIRLPYQISADIAKQYPGYEFKEVMCKIAYDNEKNQQVLYTVEIQNDTNRRTIKINADDYNF